MLRLMDYLVVGLTGLMVIVSLYVGTSFYNFNGELLDLIKVYDIWAIALIITYCAKSLLLNSDDDDFTGGKRYPLFQKVGIAYANAYILLSFLVEIPILVFGKLGISIASTMKLQFWTFVIICILYFLYQITRKNKKKF
jgi:hypothetical protein